jgi:hypothetical protein
VELSILERWGARQLRTESKSLDESVHILTIEEQASLRSIARGAVVRAGLAGALSATLSSMTAIYLNEPNTDPVHYWLVLGAVTALASVAEIAFLYWDGLRAVREMAAAAGLRIVPGFEGDELALALARAALELPSPPENVLQVNPHREANRWSLFLASLAYKAKVAFTSFVIKAIVRRAFGRALARSALELIAIPVTALWNIVVTFWVLREARLRIVGSSAALELLAWTQINHSARPLCVRAIACVIVKAQSVHPNTHLLGRLLLGSNVPPHDPGDLAVFLEQLRSTQPETALVVLRALSAAAIIDGRISRAERALLRLAFEARSLVVPWTALEDLRHHLVRGDGLRADRLKVLDAGLVRAVGRQ